MHGAFFRASANNSRTRFAPIPTNNSTKSEPLILKNGTFASPAAAFASNVLPVPGGPDKIAPYPVNQEKRGNFGEFRAESGVFVSVFEEVDEFHDFLLRLVDSRDIFERNARILNDFDGFGLESHDT